MARCRRPMIISLPLQTAVLVSRLSGALSVLVAVQLSGLGLYLPPLFKSPESPSPLQTIISLPFHTALCKSLPSGASKVLVAVQLLVLGLYLPPEFDPGPFTSSPPQTIMSLPLQIVV